MDCCKKCPNYHERDSYNDIGPCRGYICNNCIKDNIEKFICDSCQKLCCCTRDRSYTDVDILTKKSKYIKRKVCLVNTHFD